MADIRQISKHHEELKREAERRVIGALLYPENSEQRISEFMRRGGASMVDDHYLAPIADAIAEMHGKGMPVDYLTTGDTIRKRGLDDKRNDPFKADELLPFLASLASNDGVMASVHFPWWLDRLEELSRRRDLQTGILDAAGKFADPTQSTQDIVQTVKDAISRAEENTQGTANKVVLSGLDAFMTYPPSYNWMLKGSLRKESLGVIAGPPGAGKGTMAIQWCVAAAAGVKWLDNWEVVDPCNTLFISAEDDADIIHRRIHYAVKALPEGLQYAAADRITAESVSGRCELFREENGKIMATGNLDDLDSTIARTRAELVILDTLARFFGVNENDNKNVTACCAQLETLCKKHHCNIILLHHVNKGAGDVLEDTAKLAEALSQTAIRGASALLGCVRWAMIAVPLGKTLAYDRLGNIAANTADGAFVAVRVAKKNAGRNEPRHFYGRDDHGLLYPVEELGREALAEVSVEDDAEELTEAIKARAAQGLPPVSRSKGARELGIGGGSRAEAATVYALQNGMLIERENPRRKGTTILLPVEEEPGAKIPVPDLSSPASPVEPGPLKKAI